MAQSLNTKVDLTIKATCLMGLSKYGQVMVGDRAFEFYNDRNVEDFIQIPWIEVDRVEASVLFNKKIARFVLFTKNGSHFTFSTRDNKKTLRAINLYIPGDRLLRSLSAVDVLKSGISSITKKRV